MALLMKEMKEQNLVNIWPSKESALQFYEQVYKPLVSICNGDAEILSWLPIDAASTDKNQSIYSTLPNSDEGFWGSLGYDDPKETLAVVFDLGENYQTKLLKDITIIFTHFYYVYQGDESIGTPIYPSKFVEAEISFHPNKPIYTSPRIQVPSTVDIGQQVNIKIPIFPDIVIGRYVKIKFVGLHSKHTLKDDKFYLCVDKIIPVGHSDIPFDIEELESAVAHNYEQE